MTADETQRSAESDAVAEPLFGFPVGPWFKWFAWHPTKTTDRGWRWLRPVWRRRYQTHSYLRGPTMHWFHDRVIPPASTEDGA
jgi:hypothetical protein